MRTSPGGSWLPWAAGALLVALLAALGVLQLRWLGQVGDAERQRLEAGVANAMDAFAAEVDREVSRAWLAFFRPGRLPLSDAEVADLAAAWRENAPDPELIAELLVVADGEDGGAAQTYRLDAAGRREAGPPSPDPALPEGAGVARWGGTALLSGLPGIAVPLERPEAIGPRPGMRRGPAPGGGDGRRTERTLVVVFDRAFLAEEFLPRLIEEHLVPVLGPDLEARVTVRETGEVIWASEPGLEGRTEDFEWRRPLFDLLPHDALRRLILGSLVDPAFRPGGIGPEGRPSDTGEAPAWRDLRRQHALMHRMGRHGAGWILAVRPAEGSLDAALARARAGNLAVGTGILLLLTLAAAALALTTRRAQAQARRQLEFTAAVSHELRTPLAAIRSLADNLADGIVRQPEQARRYGRELARQGERLSEMVEQVLALGSLEARQRAPEVAPVDLAPLVAEAAASAARAFEGARVETDLTPDLPPVVADPPALRRAVENLVANALKHGGDGGDQRWVRVRLHAPPPGREVRIEVSDRGPGIPPEDREHLFEPFFRGRRARDAQRPGAGLGLHLVRRVAEVHGGRVEVESGAGGSTFSLCLPAGRRPESGGSAA